MSERIEQFVPAPGEPPVTVETFCEAIRLLRPDLTAEQLDGHVALFIATKQRVEWPCRRVGAYVRRAGPVLFDPAQHARRQLAEESEAVGSPLVRQTESP